MLRTFALVFGLQKPLKDRGREVRHVRDVHGLVQVLRQGRHKIVLETGHRDTMRVKLRKREHRKEE
jgi:hypothetical protein